MSERGVGMPKIVKILLTLLAVVVGIFLVLFIASRIAGYDSIWGLIQYLMGYLGFIVERSF